MDLQLGFWADPIYKNGDYPEYVKDVMKNHADQHGYVRPKFTQAEIDENKNSVARVDLKIIRFLKCDLD